LALAALRLIVPAYPFVVAVIAILHAQLVCTDFCITQLFLDGHFDGRLDFSNAFGVGILVKQQGGLEFGFLAFKCSFLKQAGKDRRTLFNLILLIFCFLFKFNLMPINSTGVTLT
jgi:hypothetical protein